MMVTFVSQCEKKALNKTRRVLDSFANRIGDKTWQTVITNEGLNAVKKLLRKTASKNTAVSCHWIRSRSRSDFLWVVGNKDKFDTNGMVPVNFTNQQNILEMDITSMDIKKYYANTNKQPLEQHLFAVGYLSNCIIRKFVDDEKLANATFVAGCLHDIGKIDPAFQSWIIDKTKKGVPGELSEEGQHIDKKSGIGWFEKHPRHNEISLLLYHLMNDEAYGKINKPNKDRIKHALYWHHAKPIRKEEFKKLETVYGKLKKNIGDAEFSLIIEVFKQIVNGVNSLSGEHSSEEPLLLDGFLNKIDEDRIYGLDDVPLPRYKRYPEGKDDVDDYSRNITENAKNNLARAAVVTADRLVSELSSEALNAHIGDETLDTLLETALSESRGLKQEIQACLDSFNQRFPNSHRNNEQAKAAQELSESEDDESSVKVLNGPAGCGKTKIALEWAAITNAKKILWICPRVQVCQGLIKDLTSSDYLPDTKIEINTGEFKSIYQFGKKPEDTPVDKEFSGDIVVTTIDQILNAIITHKSVTTLVTYMNSHVVFDEYHEYINMPAFNLLFAELVECKKLQKNRAKALLVSATPNYFFVEEFLGIDRNDIKGIDSFNQSKYRIEFKPFDEGQEDEPNPLYQKQPKNTFVISNTAITAQKSFIHNQNSENAILFHGRYKKSDKQYLFDKVFDSFKRDGNKAYEVLRAGPIIQASLNITCDRMVTEFTNAENWLQRLGRLDRFGLNQETNEYITAIPQTLAIGGKQTSQCARFLKSLNSLQSSKAWHEFLQDKLPDEPVVSLTQVYQIYQEFYDSNKCCEAVEQDLIKALKESVKVLAKNLLAPVSFPNKKKPKDGKLKIKKNSLRGENRFVQMAVCRINENSDLSFPDEYACNDSGDDVLTLSLADIEGSYGHHEKSDEDLLAFMYQKDHKIQAMKTGKTVRQKFSNNIIRNEARALETPIYVSYTREDLNRCNDKPHPHAIYYAIGNKQPIGSISINKLINPKGE